MNKKTFVTAAVDVGECLLRRSGSSYTWEKVPGTRVQDVSLTFVARGALGMVLFLAFAAK